MLEDINLMRALPNMKILSPCDDRQTKWAVKEASKISGPVYIRLSRLATPQIYDDNQIFEFGKAVQIGDGTTATIFSTGDILSEVILAKDLLEKEGINVRIVDIHTIKPIDKDLIIKSAKETNLLISVENHSIIGGLGTAISEVLTDYYPKKLIRLGIKDTFGKSGKAIELIKYFKLNSEEIANVVKENI